MILSGEGFFAVNLTMDFMCLYASARLCALPLRPGKALAAAAAGAVYAILALFCPGMLGAAAGILLSAGAMALIAFGKQAPRGFSGLVIAGLMLAGAADFLSRLLPDDRIVYPACLLCAWGLGALPRLSARPCVNGELKILWKNREVRVGALVDTGNLALDALTGLSVVVVPQRVLRDLAPEVSAGDLLSPGALPYGMRFIRVSTAGGSALLPCFHPAALEMRTGGKHTRENIRRFDAVVAVARGNLPRALIPDKAFGRQAPS